MSERLRKEIAARREIEIDKRIRYNNRVHLSRMHSAGEAYKIRRAQAQEAEELKLEKATRTKS